MTAHNRNPIPEAGLNSKILEMAMTMDEYTIADRTGLNVQLVASVIAANSRSKRWCARCNRTGRTVNSVSERGAYLKAQIAGFADWSFVRVVDQ